VVFRQVHHLRTSRNRGIHWVHSLPNTNSKVEVLRSGRQKEHEVGCLYSYCLNGLIWKYGTGIGSVGALLLWRGVTERWILEN
jgi:hypothetical protein